MYSRAFSNQALSEILCVKVLVKAPKHELVRECVHSFDRLSIEIRCQLHYMSQLIQMFTQHSITESSH